MNHLDTSDPLKIPIHPGRLCYVARVRIFRANDFLDAMKQAAGESSDWRFDHLDIVLGHWVYYFNYKGRKFGGGKLRMSASAAANDESAEHARILLHVERWPRNNGWEPLTTPEPLAATLLEGAKRIHFRGLRIVQKGASHHREGQGRGSFLPPSLRRRGLGEVSESERTPLRSPLGKGGGKKIPRLSLRGLLPR